MTDPYRFISSPDAPGATTTDDPAPTGAPAPTADQNGDGQPSEAAAAAAPAPAEAPSAAEVRFQSCRWRKAETPPFCSHPEVLPFAGTTGFKPDAWCPGCAFYKLRRNPRRDY
jgi:hypothetical protein